MTTVELRFPANRYHGTGWGRHVNEGVAEWPPSPYRLVRALYDAWKRKCPHLSEQDVVDVFTTLASRLPRFWLPKAVSAHTRSYLSSNTGDAADKSLIFDAFVAVSPSAACIVEWEFSLNERQRGVLRELLSALNYLGRSESWVEARLGGPPPVGPPTCIPASEASGIGELVYLACPVSPHHYRGKRSWLDALTYSTGELLKERLSGPPAMQAVPYELAMGAVTTWLPARSPGRNRGISAAVLELHGRVLPVATDAIRIAERVRGRLMRQFEENKKQIPALIHGKDIEGGPLKDHSHLFILPRTNSVGRIDSVFLFSLSESFKPDVIEAIAGIKYLRWLDSVGLTAAWMGQRDDASFRPRADTVVSKTPFVTIRHWRRGRGTVADFLIEEIRRECRNHGLPRPVSVEPLPLAGRFPPVKFRRHREGDVPRPGYAFRLKFGEPVAAPFSLGYGCHFGLGQFGPEM